MGNKHNKDPDTDRSGGGPGSSHQGGSHGHVTRPAPSHTVPRGGQVTSDARSHASGGGGERDSHHSADPEKKGDRKGY